MAPEQARGKTVDKRADIWAFGCVLYEMLTGTRAFAGDDVSEVLASVLAREPDWARLPSTLSPALGTYLRRCLHKNAKQRIADAPDIRLALEGAFETAIPQAGAPLVVPVWRRVHRA
jgi:serine/threonine protein kinase